VVVAPAVVGGRWKLLLDGDGGDLESKLKLLFISDLFSQ